MRSAIQSFIAGFFGPAIVLLPLYVWVVQQGDPIFLRTYPIYAIPFLWGVWNMLYYYIGRHIILLKKIGVWGVLLGIGTSLAGIYFFHTMDIYQRHVAAGVVMYQILILDVVIYFLLWESVVRYLNRILID